MFSYVKYFFYLFLLRVLFILTDIMENITLYTPERVADILHTSKAQVLIYINTGRLKARRLSPRIIRVTGTALTEFLNNAK